MRPSSHKKKDKKGTINASDFACKHLILIERCRLFLVDCRGAVHRTRCKNNVNISIYITSTLEIT